MAASMSIWTCRAQERNEACGLLSTGRGTEEGKDEGRTIG